jgi:hypothetical protein
MHSRADALRPEHACGTHWLGRRCSYSCTTAGVKLLPRLANEWDGLVVEAKLAFGENALRFLTGLREGDDRVAIDCDSAAILSQGAVWRTTRHP